jgi:hypothetical protein
MEVEESCLRLVIPFDRPVQAGARSIVGPAAQTMRTSEPLH